MSLRSEFRQFLLRGNVVDLAVAVIIGAAFGGIVTAFVDDLIMPGISPLLPGGEWRTYAPGGFKIGHFGGAVIDFLIKAFCIFIVLVKFVGALKNIGAKPELPVEPKVKTCPECLESVPAAARRCRACTSALAS